MLNNIQIGSFPNSNRQIEPELLRIIMQHWRLGDHLSYQSNNTKLVKALKLIKPRETSGSLADTTILILLSCINLEKFSSKKLMIQSSVTNRFLEKYLRHVKIGLPYLMIFIKS